MVLGMALFNNVALDLNFTMPFYQVRRACNIVHAAACAPQLHIVTPHSPTFSPFPACRSPPQKLLSAELQSRNVRDLHEVHPTIASSLQQLLDYEGDDVEDVFALTFAITMECVVGGERCPGLCTARH